MKKRIVVPTALLVVGMVAVPSLASARRSADDSIESVRREDRRQVSSSVPASSTAAPSASVVEDNPTSVSPAGVDLRGDGTPEDNGTTTQTPASSPAPAQASSSVSREQAIAIATTTLPGKSLKKVESEVEHGVEVWSVRFTDDSRVDVSKSDGSVTRVRER